MKKWILIYMGLMTSVSCSVENESDAFGQFEADEVVISSENSGRLLSFSAEEGETLEIGTAVGLVDTTQLHLQKEELKASILSIESNREKLNAQKAVLQSQLETAQKELSRLQSLKREQAATQQQIDSAEGQVNTLLRQIQSVDVEHRSITTEVNKVERKIDQVNEQIGRAIIKNPIQGTVLKTFAEQHELVSAGRPLYSIANLEQMILRVYVSGAQLPHIILGDRVKVVFDQNATENQEAEGYVSWIAQKAEFTPRMIQTKEERVTQVYAVKIRVDNPDGSMKIGMPGEVRFASDETENE